VATMTTMSSVWQQIAEDELIAAYVPDAEIMSHDEALHLALARDAEAAGNLQEDALLIGACCPG